MVDMNKALSYVDGRETEPDYQQIVGRFLQKGLSTEQAHRTADLFYDLERYETVWIDDPVYDEFLRSAQTRWTELQDDYENPAEAAQERYKEFVMGEAAMTADPDAANVPVVPSNVLWIQPKEHTASRNNRYQTW